MRSLKIFFLSITLTTIDAFNNLVPPNKELIYSWIAEVNAGTHHTVSYASQFALRGKMHLQSNNESVYVKISNLKYRIYNGIINHDENKTREIPIPKEVYDLENIFRIVYNEEGTVAKIATLIDEKEFSKNIKKAIATIFQLKNAIFDKNHHSEPFSVKENTIFGHGKDVYSVFQHGEDIEVHKSHQMFDSQENSSDFITNAEPSYSDLKSNEKVTRTSQKVYVLFKQNDTYLVKNITTTGSIVYVPFKVVSEGYVILVNQTFHLEDTIPVKDKYQIELEHYEDSLAYRPFLEDEEALILDITNGRHETIYEKLIPLVQSLLKDISEYFEEDHIKEETLDFKHGQMINRVQRMLVKFSFKKLGELKTTLSGEALTSFYHVLPLIGSEASTLYIKTLIVENIVDETMAINLLQLFTENIKPSVRLVNKLEDLIHLNESFSWNLQKTAILSFGTIIQRSYYNHHILAKHDANTDLQEPYHKYIDEYIENLKNSTSYEVQLTYLLGLRNMKLDNSTLRKIFTFMMTKADEELYRFHYTFTHSLAQTKDPYYKEISEQLTQMMKFNPRALPQREITSANFSDYVDFDYGFGAEIQDIFIKTNDSRIYVKCLNSQQDKINEEEFLLYLKVHDGDASDGLMSSIERIRYSIANGQKTDISIEAVISKRKQIIGVYVFNNNNIQALNESINYKYFLSRNFKPVKKHFLHMTYLRHRSSLIPTDLGIPAISKYSMPVVFQGDLRVSTNVSENYNNYYDYKVQGSFESRFNLWIHFCHGLTFYNPIADVWHGINRLQKFDATLPLHFDIFLDNNEPAIHNIWKKYSNNLMNIAGINSHTALVVFATEPDDSNTTILNDFVPHGEEFQVVGNGEKIRHDYPLTEKDDINTGYRFSGKLYDSDIRVESSSVKNRIFQILNPSSKHFNTPVEYIALTIGNLIYNLLLLPRSGTYGYIIKFEPSQKYPVTDIDLAFGSDFKHNYRFIHYYNAYVNYTVKNEDKIIRRWSTSLKYFFWSNYFQANAQVTRTDVDGKEYKICLNTNRKTKRKNVLVNLGVTMGDGNQCVNNTFIEIAMKGQCSNDQNDGNYEHTCCERVVPLYDPYYKKRECWANYITLPHNTYDVKTYNIPNDLKLYFSNWWNDTRSFVKSYYSHKFQENNVSDDALKIDVEYPFDANQVNVEISTNKETYEFSGIPSKYLNEFVFSLDSIIFPRGFLQYERGRSDHCRIYYGESYLNNDFIKEEISLKFWKEYLRERRHSFNGFTLQIERRNDTKLGLKVMDLKHKFIVHPKGDEFEIELTGPKAFSQEYREEWMFYEVLPEINLLIAFFTEDEVFVKYNGEYIEIMTPKRNYFGLRGICKS